MASSNVCVSQPTSRCITSDIACTWHEQVEVVLQIWSSAEPPTKIETNFLHHGKFECLGGATDLKMHHNCHRMHIALSSCHSWSNPTQLWIRNCTEVRTKFFPLWQVRMSGCRTEPQDTSDLTWNARFADRLSLVFPSGRAESKIVQKDKFFHHSKFECLGVASSLKMWWSAVTDGPSYRCTWHGQGVVRVPINRAALANLNN